ncbi:MAG: aspartate/glutamate racemase family protein [Candidatus Saccharibacteria bacterium]
MKLGVFDSGIGGEAIAAALRLVFPMAIITTVNDHKNVPYGSKTPSEIIHLTDIAIQPLINADCDIIILACNTATAVAIESLRTKYPNQKFIGIEPMVKTAAELTKSHIIAVCATPATLASDRYSKLVKKFGAGLSIIEPDCSSWAQMIEDDQINYRLISQTINDICGRGADVIVLGCTHYNWIKDSIIKIADGRAQTIEPSSAIGNRVKQLLQLR